MPPAQTARLAVVSVALAIVVGSAGYGIARGIEEGGGNSACETYMERLKRDLRLVQEEAAENRTGWTGYTELSGLDFVQTGAPCTCEELAAAFPASTTVECFADQVPKS